MKGNLIGLSAFKGPKGHESPHHAFVTGKTGSGKSFWVIDFLTQIDPHADKTIVVDFGNSYGMMMKVLSGGTCQSFEPDPNGQDSLNYWDTGSLPLSPLFQNSVVSVLHLMAGHKGEEDEDYLRGAIIARSVRLFFIHWAEQWIKEKPERQGQLVQTLAALRCFARANKIKGELTDIYPAYCHAVDETEIDQISLDGEASQIRDDDDELIKLAFAFMSRDEAPTHSDFHDWLEKYGQQAGYGQEELSKLVILLEIWRADRGIMGKLFDGVNTIDLGAKHVHIELGRIADADDRIRSLVSFVLSNKILGAINRMPRAQRKHVVLEELGAFLNIKGAKQLVREFYERARKLNCWVLSVIQQISNLPEDLARSVIGNCRQGFFFMQREPKDTELLQEIFELPDVIVETLKNFKEPTVEQGASFICWENLGNRDRITPAVNLSSAEMFYVANSSGGMYEAREKALAQYDDILEGITIEAVKLVASDE